MGIVEAKIALAAAEERNEDLPEVLTHLVERRVEELARGRVDLPDRLLEGQLGIGEIGSLCGEEVEALQRFVVLLDRQYVHWPERLDLAPQQVRVVPQRALVGLHFLDRGQPLLDRAPPFCLEPLANRGPPSTQLRQTEPVVVEIVAPSLRATAGGVERMFGCCHPLLGLPAPRFRAPPPPPPAPPPPLPGLPVAPPSTPPP